MGNEKDDNNSSEKEALAQEGEFHKSGGGDIFEAPARISESEMETPEGESSSESSED